MKRGRKRRQRYTRNKGRRNITLRDLYNKYNGTCQGPCGRQIPFSEATKEHYIPRSRGGSNKRQNLKLFCWNCNQIKADAMPRV